MLEPLLSLVGPPVNPTALLDSPNTYTLSQLIMACESFGNRYIWQRQRGAQAGFHFFVLLAFALRDRSFAQYS